MKKIFFTIFILFVVSVSSIFALTISEMLERAKEESDVYKSTLFDAQVSDYSALIQTYDKQNTFTFGVKNGSWSRTPKSLTDQSESVLFTPSFDFTSAADNKTSISLSSPISINTFSPQTKSTYNPSLSVTQNILLDGVKDTESDLTKQKGILSAASALKKAEKNYENTFYLTLANLLTAEGDYLTSKNKLSIAENDFLGEINSKSIEEGSFTYKEKESNVISLQNDRDTKKTLYDQALNEFKRVAGFDYEEIDMIPFPNITFALNEEGNTTVRLSLLDKLIAKNKYDVLTRNDDRVLALDILGKTKVEGKDIDSYGFKGGVSYTDTSLKLSAGLGGDFNKSSSWTFEPTVNFDLEYSVGSSNNETKRLSIQKAALEMQNKSFDYDNALLSYKTDAITMLSDIAIQNANYRQIQNTYENAALSFEKNMDLYNKGYYTPLTFETEQINFKNAKNNYNVFMLKSLILKNNAEMLNI